MRKVSIVIFTVFTIAITALTIYTLTNKKIEGTQEIIKIKTIEKASSNMTEKELSEVFNIELNGKRHRLKSNYRLSNEEEQTSLMLTLYLDGFEILTKEILSNIKEGNIDEIFTEEENVLLIDEDDIHVIKEDQDYLLVSIDSDIDGLKEEYFVWTVTRKSILDSILVYDEKIEFASEESNIFYDEDATVLAKVEDNTIYVLEPLETEEGLVLEEYTYNIKNEEATKELINTYEIEQTKKAQ